MEMPLAAELGASPRSIVLSIVFLAIVFHVLLVWLFPLSDRTWKILDYVWVSLAALGVVASSMQAERFAARNEIQYWLEPRVEATYDYLYEHVVYGAQDDGPLCRQRTQTKYSPDEFDEIVAEQQSLCEWANEVQEHVRSKVEKPYPSIDEIGMKPLPDRAGKYMEWYVTEMRRWKTEYEKFRTQYVLARERARHGAFETSFILVGPVLLAIAVALRLTRVSGELRNRGK